MYDELENAIDKALEMLGLNKICKAVEDSKAYYFTGCGDNGETIFGCATCKVEKRTLACSACYHDDPCWSTPKTSIKFPKTRQGVFIKREY